MDKAEYAQGQLHLIVSYRPLGLVRATARRLDSDSIDVDTGCIVLPDGAEVEVTLSYPSTEGSRVERLAARVARSAPGETRLTLEGADRTAVERVLTSGYRPAVPTARGAGRAAVSATA